MAIKTIWRPRQGGEVDEWTAKIIKERDNFRCLRCGRKDKLSIHHLQGRATNLQRSQDYDNLVTLCIDCHCWIHDIATRMEKFILTQRLSKKIKGKMI